MAKRALPLIVATTFLLGSTHTSGSAVQVTPPTAGFASQGVCRYLLNDVGWWPCRTSDCLAGNYNDWPVWKDLQAKCTTACRFSAYGTACEFGDVYPYARNGINIGFKCQCSGSSANSICAKRRNKLKNIMGPSVKRITITRARNICNQYCHTFRPGSANNDHCGKAMVTSSGDMTTTLSPTLFSKRRRRVRTLPYSEYWCTCVGYSGTAEDDGGQIELPEFRGL